MLFDGNRLCIHLYTIMVMMMMIVHSPEHEANNGCKTSVVCKGMQSAFRSCMDEKWNKGLMFFCSFFMCKVRQASRSFMFSPIFAQCHARITGELQKALNTHIAFIHYLFSSPINL